MYVGMYRCQLGNQTQIGCRAGWPYLEQRKPDASTGTTRATARVTESGHLVGTYDGAGLIFLHPICINNPRQMNPERKIKIGVVGSGFGASFLFHKHPHSIVEAISANLPDERAKLQSVYQCSKAYPSLREMLRDSDIDAVALFTPAPLHARHTVEALHAGKHVLCAVPAGMSIDECAQV